MHFFFTHETYLNPRISFHKYGSKGLPVNSRFRLHQIDKLYNKNSLSALKYIVESLYENQIYGSDWTSFHIRRYQALVQKLASHYLHWIYECVQSIFFLKETSGWLHHHSSLFWGPYGLQT